MENKINNINEEKLESETSVNKEESTKNDNPELVKCPDCGRMVSIEDLRSQKPFRGNPVCAFCESEFQIPYRMGLIAIWNSEYIDRITKNKVEINLSLAIESLYMFYPNNKFDFELSWNTGNFISYDWGDIPDEEKESNMLALENFNQEIIAKYESEFGEMTYVMNKNKTCLSIYFSDEYENSKEFLNNFNKYFDEDDGENETTKQVNVITDTKTNNQNKGESL